jgi:hypothetical protein
VGVRRNAKKKKERKKIQNGKRDEEEKKKNIRRPIHEHRAELHNQECYKPFVQRQPSRQCTSS